eukprot:CAMPEP_0172790860 /NCGR_PEP_ID=MMETSP1074-20121228/208181_1 /TAXON_ID=2916 /ORGANISM="Ceratium fusus, Strain PA161109" /LENGTH=155 /DNA_ID=CAMNT_0013627915 /DNA_START=713 /DNA_END=1181 /DNA_ORIENTATION=-
MVSTKDAMRAQEHFHGFLLPANPSNNVCEVSWGKPVQGLEANIERFWNSPVMHQVVPDEFKPMLFSQGCPTPFLGPPTQSTTTHEVPQEPKGCAVIAEGLEANIERFWNSPVMHQVVPDEFKPMLFNKGCPTPFPGPTKPIRPSRMNFRKNQKVA